MAVPTRACSTNAGTRIAAQITLVIIIITIIINYMFMFSLITIEILTSYILKWRQIEMNIAQVWATIEWLMVCCCIWIGYVLPKNWKRKMKKNWTKIVCVCVVKLKLQTNNATTEQILDAVYELISFGLNRIDSKACFLQN